MLCSNMFPTKVMNSCFSEEKKTFLVGLAKNTEYRQQLLGILSSVPNGLLKTVYIFVLFCYRKKG